MKPFMQASDLFEFKTLTLRHLPQLLLAIVRKSPDLRHQSAQIGGIYRRGRIAQDFLIVLDIPVHLAQVHLIELRASHLFHRFDGLMGLTGKAAAYWKTAVGQRPGHRPIHPVVVHNRLLRHFLNVLIAAIF